MPLPTRPLLKPALRQVWRDDATLQLGLEPRRAIVLEGLAPPDSRLLALLDGSRDVATVFAEANDVGCGPERAARLIELLHAADALDDAPPGDPRLAPDVLSLSLLHRGAGAASRVLARRRNAAVVVYGAGRVGATLVGLLVAAGVGSVHVVDDAAVRPSDLSPGGIREHNIGSRARAALLPWRQRRVRTDPRGAQLAVIAPAGSTTPAEVLTAARRVPHLLVVVRETVASVGPLVVPGTTPCLRCLHLSRVERDPAWAAMTAQLAGTRRADEACDVVLATLAAALGALHALQHLDGAPRPSSVGGVLEYDLADGRLRRRSVVAHATCGCGAAHPEATMEP